MHTLEQVPLYKERQGWEASLGEASFQDQWKCTKCKLMASKAIFEDYNCDKETPSKK